MFARRAQVKPVIAVPVGAILPDNLGVPVITEGTFLEKLAANSAEKIAIVALTTEELIALVEKPHLFGTDVVALVGAPGGRYDAVWSSYIAPLRRISLETLNGEIKKILEHQQVDAIDPPPVKTIVSVGIDSSLGQTQDESQDSTFE